MDRTSKIAMGAMIVPRHVLGGTGYQAPSDQLNLAIVGVGGQGTENAQEFGAEHIAAICDVDFGVCTGVTGAPDGRGRQPAREGPPLA